MELFERVKYLAKNLAGSETKLAALLGLPQRTFNHYLSKKSQDNLWKLLPCILEVFPQIHREWLYFGEGEMAGADIDGVALLAAIHDSGKEQISLYQADLEKENALLREILADKARIIALQDEKLAAVPAKTER